MRREWFGLQLWMKLDADKPRVIFPFDDLRQAAIRGHAGEDQPAFFELLAILGVDLIAVAVAFFDGGVP